ncbi:PREDICTED: NAD(P)H dehydrogenase (quinone) FQR1-like isoform X1 [Brassica oleracea var. oleracea]|uniref:NAD(P)H dehydrogenase (quinone) FQR1-like isoform X1 n=1 Tax=Brassica oleracea var. oleracea TaxID=109376 RepID=UPI0006A73A45|nr:PREDICTED: NAD(P)H dehydrogenase (quinone) FQR1-like isoform X1 [Brassica oleracea var. oleracea]
MVQHLPLPLIIKVAVSVEGVETKLWQVPETLPEEALSKMSTPPKSESPIITPDELTEADGFVFGFPTRYGMMAAQFKVFLDTTGGLRRTQSLAGKPAGSSTALALKVVAKKPLRKFP